MMKNFRKGHKKFFLKDLMKCFFDNETTLLKGPSGKGKTTIFESIKWCLYGGNKNVFPLLGKKETMVFVKFSRFRYFVSSIKNRLKNR